MAMISPWEFRAVEAGLIFMFLGTLKPPPAVFQMMGRVGADVGFVLLLVGGKVGSVGPLDGAMEGESDVGRFDGERLDAKTEGVGDGGMNGVPLAGSAFLFLFLFAVVIATGTATMTMIARKRIAIKAILRSRVLL